MPQIQALKRWGYQNDPFEGPVVAGQRLEVSDQRARFLVRKNRAVLIDAKGNKIEPEPQEAPGNADSGHGVRLIRRAPVAQPQPDPAPERSQVTPQAAETQASPTGAARDLSSSSAPGRQRRTSVPQTGKKSAGGKKAGKRKSSR